MAGTVSPRDATACQEMPPDPHASWVSRWNRRWKLAIHRRLCEVFRNGVSNSHVVIRECRQDNSASSRRLPQSHQARHGRTSASASSRSRTEPLSSEPGAVHVPGAAIFSTADGGTSSVIRW
jgi:hypothetical protein